MLKTKKEKTETSFFLTQGDVYSLVIVAFGILLVILSVFGNIRSEVIPTPTYPPELVEMIRIEFGIVGIACILYGVVYGLKKLSYKMEEER